MEDSETTVFLRRNPETSMEKSILKPHCSFLPESIEGLPGSGESSRTKKDVTSEEGSEAVR